MRIPPLQRSVLVLRALGDQPAGHQHPRAGCAAQATACWRNPGSGAVGGTIDTQSVKAPRPSAAGPVSSGHGREQCGVRYRLPYRARRVVVTVGPFTARPVEPEQGCWTACLGGVVVWPTSARRPPVEGPRWRSGSVPPDSILFLCCFKGATVRQRTVTEAVSGFHVEPGCRRHVKTDHCAASES